MSSLEGVPTQYKPHLHTYFSNTEKLVMQISLQHMGMKPMYQEETPEAPGEHPHTGWRQESNPELLGTCTDH